MTDPTNFDQDRRLPTASGRWTVATIKARLARESSAPPPRPSPVPRVPVSEAPTGPVGPLDSVVLAGIDAQTEPQSPQPPEPGQPWPVAPKAKAAAMWGAVGVAALEAAVTVARSYGLVDSLTADWVLVGVAALIGGLSPFTGAWRAPHQPRPGDGPTAGPAEASGNRG